MYSIHGPNITLSFYYCLNPNILLYYNLQFECIFTILLSSIYSLSLFIFFALFLFLIIINKLFIHWRMIFICFTLIFSQTHETALYMHVRWIMHKTKVHFQANKIYVYCVYQPNRMYVLVCAVVCIIKNR